MTDNVPSRYPTLTLDTFCSGSGRIPYLDGFRALSVLMVMFSHYRFAIPGHMGVTCFFLISGFLITHLLLLEAKHHPAHTIDVGAFYLRRAFRILPAMLAYIGFTVALYAAVGLATPWAEIWPSLVFFQNYNIILNFPFTLCLPLQMLWSLSVEEHYYLLAPWGFLWAVHTQRWRTLMWGILGIMGIGLLWRFYALLKLHAGFEYLFWATECRIDSILFGVLAAIGLHQAYQNPQRIYAKAFRWFTQSPWLFWVAIGILAFVWQENNVLVYNILQFPAASVAVAIMLLGALFTPGNTWFKALLDHWVMRSLGLISYSLYLWHSLVYKWTAQWYESELFFPPFGTAVIAIVLSVGVATLSYWWVEKPALKLRKALVETKAKTKTQP